ncbi:hypothetical protein AB0M86_47665 [Streptomyces sp. NPDC051639]|uniref:hypothetical protein n=1 Tax=Streptomyces sp. NPDC051639 TaxID=3155671 RepID=UPI00343E4A54
MSENEALGKDIHPEKSKYQATPWAPTIDGSNSEQKKAAEDYTNTYGGTPVADDPDKDKDDDKTPPELSGNEPILHMSYTEAPDFVPTPRSGGTKGSSSAMESGAFHVQLSALRTTEQVCLDACSVVIGEFDTLKGQVEKASAENFFGQDAGQYGVAVTTDAQSQLMPHNETFDPSKYDAESKAFAESIIPKMKNLLNAVGNATVAMGQFPALLNNTGQAYATMDNASAFVDG